MLIRAAIPFDPAHRIGIVQRLHDKPIRTSCDVVEELWTVVQMVGIMHQIQLGNYSMIYLGNYSLELHTYMISRPLWALRSSRALYWRSGNTTDQQQQDEKAIHHAALQFFCPFAW
jgi:hypothetical protein